jgi:asparagine synthase (glutamine-hydrolysing)
MQKWDEIGSYSRQARYDPNQTDSFWLELLQATSERIPTEVPFVIQLSAGIDSSLVASAVAEVGAQPAFALTVGNHNEETGLAKELSKALGFKHRSIEFPRGKALAKLVVESLDTNDEPFWDGLVPSYFINKEISRHAKVALSGDGPDELFGGYARTRLAIRAGQLEKLARFSSLPFLPNKLMHARFSGVADFVHFARNFHHPIASQVWLLSATQDSSIANVFADISGRLERVLEGLPGWPYDSLSAGIFSSEIWLSLTQILKKVDSSSMANSVEVRSPFLSNGFLSRSSDFYSGHLVRHGVLRGKIPLRHLAKRSLPKQYLKRSKTGFGFGVLPLLENELSKDWMKLVSPQSNLVQTLSQVGGVPANRIVAFIQTSDAQTKGRLFALGRYLGY